MDPTRILFAPYLSYADHLAALRLADVFLDTWPYNAHTTASDALWVGLPVLTYSGRTFAGRVAGSLLHAIGMPELVTDSLTDYEALAIKLSSDRAFLSEYKQRLERNRHTHPLFDTARFARGIEAAYTKMWETYESGERPHGFSVQSLEGAA